MLEKPENEICLFSSALLASPLITSGRVALVCGSVDLHPPYDIPHVYSGPTVVCTDFTVVCTDCTVVVCMSHDRSLSPSAFHLSHQFYLKKKERAGCSTVLQILSACTRITDNITICNPTSSSEASQAFSDSTAVAAVSRQTEAIHETLRQNTLIHPGGTRSLS